MARLVVHASWQTPERHLPEHDIGPIPLLSLALQKHYPLPGLQLGQIQKDPRLRAIDFLI